MHNKYLNIITYKVDYSVFELLKRSNTPPKIIDDCLKFEDGTIVGFISCVVYDIVKDEITDIVNSHIQKNVYKIMR